MNLATSGIYLLHSRMSQSEGTQSSSKPQIHHIDFLKLLKKINLIQ